MSCNAKRYDDAAQAELHHALVTCGCSAFALCPEAVRLALERQHASRGLATLADARDAIELDNAHWPASPGRRIERAPRGR